MTCVHSLLSGGGKAAVDGDVVSYDLSYLLTQEAFCTAYDDSLSTAREIAKPLVARTAAIAGKDGGAVGSSLFDGSWSSPFREPHDPERNLSNVLFEAMISSSSGNNHHANASSNDTGLDLDLYLCPHEGCYRRFVERARGEQRGSLVVIAAPMPVCSSWVGCAVIGFPGHHLGGEATNNNNRGIVRQKQ